MASRKEGSGNIDGIHWINQFWVVVLNIFILWICPKLLGSEPASISGPFRMVGLCASQVHLEGPTWKERRMFLSSFTSKLGRLFHWKSVGSVGRGFGSFRQSWQTAIPELTLHQTTSINLPSKKTNPYYACSSILPKGFMHHRYHRDTVDSFTTSEIQAHHILLKELPFPSRHLWYPRQPVLNGRLPKYKVWNHPRNSCKNSRTL